MTCGELNCRGVADSAFPADAVFLCDRATMAVAVLKNKITDTPCILKYHTPIGLCVLWLYS
jgi:hypothetical protein